VNGDAQVQVGFGNPPALAQDGIVECVEGDYAVLCDAARLKLQRLAKLRSAWFVKPVGVACMRATLAQLHSMGPEGSYLHESLHDSPEHESLLADLLYPLHDEIALCTAKIEENGRKASKRRTEAEKPLEDRIGPWQEHVVQDEEMAEAARCYVAALEDHDTAQEEAAAVLQQIEINKINKKARTGKCKEGGEGTTSLLSRAMRIPLEALPVAIDDAFRTGLTPVIVDRSRDHNVDTFLSYKGGDIISGKKMNVEKTKDKRPVRDILEDARRRLVHCMKQGMRLCILCENSVPDFATTFNDEAEGLTEEEARAAMRAIIPLCEQKGIRDVVEYIVNHRARKATFPVELFQQAGLVVSRGPWPRRLFREEDLEAGLAISRVEPPPSSGNPGFGVLITTRFKEEDFEHYLLGNEWGLPRPTALYQAVIVEYGEGVPMLPD